MQISLVPIDPSELQNKAFDRNKLYNCYAFLKTVCEQQHHTINTVDITPIKQADFIILLALDIKIILEIINYRKQLQTVYIPFEPPVITPWHQANFLIQLSKLFPYIITWQDDLIGQSQFMKFHIPYYEIRETIPTVAFTQKKLLTMVIGYKSSPYADELYSQRLEMIEFFDQTCPEQFDYYGAGWPKLFRTYKGAPKDKLTQIAHYKFAICFENQCNINGYVTEKILDCLNAKVVPIYWGATNIVQYIPHKCYINYQDFTSKQALYEFLVNMTEAQYAEYLQQAQAFLNSAAYKVFLPHYFAEHTVKLITHLPAAKQPSIVMSWLIVLLILSKKLQHKIILQLHKLCHYFSLFRRSASK